MDGVRSAYWLAAFPGVAMLALAVVAAKRDESGTSSGSSVRSLCCCFQALRAVPSIFSTVHYSGALQKYLGNAGPIAASTN